MSQQVSTTIQEEARRGLFIILKWLFICFMGVVLLRNFVAEPFRIPSASMYPTLQVGDHIFASKFDYGFYIPFLNKRFVVYSKPLRGDVIVFLYPKNESLHYVKRVIGLPGENVLVEGHDVYINGKKIIIEELNTSNMKSIYENGTFLEETLENKKHTVQFLQDLRWKDPQHFIVPQDHYFVMGDNRDDSSDSRVWGFVPFQNIRGKARWVWLSIDQENAWGKLNRIRWDRIGLWVK